MSARILLSTFGSFGDIHPFLALAHELKARGHTPTIATSELYRAKIEAEGIAFHAVRPDLPPPAESLDLMRRVMHPLYGPSYLFRKILMPALRDSYEDLRAEARESDLIVSHTITFGAPLAAQVLGKKWLSVTLAPILLWSLDDPSFSVGVPLREAIYRMPRAFHRANYSLGMSITRAWLRPVGAIRKELKLPRGKHPLFKDAFSPHGTLALFSGVLAAPQPDWPTRTTTCGYCFYDRKGEFQTDAAQRDQNINRDQARDESALRRWLDEGDAPLVFTLGTAAVFDARDFYAKSLSVAQRLNRRALLLIGARANRPASLPHNTLQNAAFEYAPYGEVFPRAAAIVHQGGAGTTGQVLRAGVPSLVMPYSHDQPDHAMRLQRLGIGRALARWKYSPKRAARELDAILSDEKYARRAREIAVQVRSENGPRAAAEAIENVLNS